jgi:hypothetical protein
MNKLFERIICNIFNEHCYGLHRADYEVCDDIFCRFGNWLERVTGYWEAPNER